MVIGTRFIHDCAVGRTRGFWIFTVLQEQRLIAIRVECIGLESTSIKVHPDARGGSKKSENPEADGTPKFIWLARMIERP